MKKDPERMRKPRRAAILAVLAALNVARVRAAVVQLPDGRFELSAPWTDDEHTTVCPNPDPRVCPVFVMDEPAMIIRSQDSSVRLRDAARLTDKEKARGARVPFFLYNYKYDPVLEEKRYTEYDGPDRIQIRSAACSASSLDPIFSLKTLESCNQISASDAQRLLSAALLTPWDRRNTMLRRRKLVASLHKLTLKAC